MIATKRVSIIRIPHIISPEIIVPGEVAFFNQDCTCSNILYIATGIQELVITGIDATGIINAGKVSFFIYLPDPGRS